MKMGVRVVLVIWAMAMCGCLAPQNTQMVGVDMQSWDSAESIIFDNSDTLSLRNINITLRYNSDFEHQTLPLKITVITPDSTCFEEVIELHPRPTHRSFVVATTEKLPYRTDAVLSQRGEYRFCFEPLCEVVGLEAIGIEFQTKIVANGKR